MSVRISMSEVKRMGEDMTDNLIKNGGILELFIGLMTNTFIALVLIFFTYKLAVNFHLEYDLTVLALPCLILIPFTFFIYVKSLVRTVVVYIESRKPSELK